MKRHPNCTDTKLHNEFHDDFGCPVCARLHSEDATTMNNEDLASKVATKLMEGGLGEAVRSQLDRAERRLVRIETRNTNALRYLGLVPGKDSRAPGKASVIVNSQGDVVVTGMDATVRDIAEAAVLSGRTGEVNILIHNHVWGVVHIASPAAN